MEPIGLLVVNLIKLLGALSAGRRQRARTSDSSPMPRRGSEVRVEEDLKRRGWLVLVYHIIS